MAERDTQALSAGLLGLKVAAATTIERGSLVVVSSGYAASGVLDAAAWAAGSAEETVDNSAGGAGDETIAVRRGVFQWENSVSNPVTQAEVGQLCYVANATTVSKDNVGGTRPVAGRVLAVDAEGVWVETGL